MIKIDSQCAEMLDRVVANGQFQSRGEAIAEALRLLEENSESAAAESSSLLPPEEWIREFTAWARSHRPRNPNVDDSRESIYEGRRD